jgi:alkylhydroperoxidase family enzyme
VLGSDARDGDGHSTLLQVGEDHRLATIRQAWNAERPRFHDSLAENFSAEEILEIVAVVANMNVWTRIKLAEGARPGPA